MKVLTWNIRNGGANTRSLVGALNNHAADVIVLTEYRSTSDLPNSLSEAGWLHQLSTSPAPGVNGILVAARMPLKALPPDPEAPALSERWLEIEVPSARLSFSAVHIPGEPDKRNKPDPERWDKRTFWTAVTAVARRRTDTAHFLVGDFNTGKNPIDAEGTPFKCSEFIDRLEALGWADSWRHHHPHERDFTWFSRPHGNGFRLDHLWVAPRLVPRLRSSQICHEERKANLSDHSLLLVDLENS